MNAAAQEHLKAATGDMGADVDALKQLVSMLNKQTGMNRLKHGTLDAAASFLMRTAGARGDKQQLMRMLHEFYSYVGQNDNLSWEAIQQEARPIAEWLTDHMVRTKQMSEYAAEILDTVRHSRIYLDDAQRKEVAYAFGSYGAYRSAMMGSVVLANDHSISLDMQWQEWAGMYPDVFDEDMNATDMPGELMNIIQRMRNSDTSELEFEYNRDFIIQDLTNRVYDSYWNAATLYIVADQYEQQIRQLKGKHKQRMAEVYQRHRDAEKALRQEFKRRTEALQAHYEERYQRRESEYRDSRRNAVERHDKAQIRQQIRKDVERLASLLNKGNKQKNVKQELQAFACAALRTAQGTFLNNYNEYDMIRNGLNATMNREQKQVFQRCQELLEELDKLRDEKSMEPGATNMHDKWDPEAALRREDREEALKKELSKNMRILRDAGLFRTENELMEDSNAEQLLDESPFAQALTKQQLDDAYTLGLMAGKKTAEQRQAKVQNEKKRQSDKKGKLHFEGDRGKLTERQKVSLQICEVVAKALGIDVYVFESQKGENGKRVGDNGWYDPKDGSIHIDLYAGQNGEGVMVFTLAHELVHFIKDWSPVKFRKLAGFLAEQYGKKGVSIRDLVLEKQAKAKEDGRKLSFDQAYEEWVADSMETMLTDGAVVEKLSQLQATDKGLAQKIREFIKGFVQRLKNAYKGISAQTKEGQIVSEMVDAAQQLQDLFADALIDAGNTYRSTEKNTTDDGSVNEVMYSIRQTRKMSLKDQLSAYYKRKFRQSDSFYFGMTPTVLAESGLDLEPLAFNQDDFKKSTKDKHNIPRRVLNKLAENLGKPIFSFSAGKQVAVAIDDIDADGKPVVVAIHGGHVMDRAPINLIKSLYGVESIKTWVGQQIDGGGKFRVYDIEKANAMLQTQGYLAAVGTQSDGSWDIITKVADAVKGESDVKQSARVNDGLSPRELLLNTVEGMVANDTEYKKLQEYRQKIQELNATEEHLERLNAKLKELYFAKGGRDYEMINNGNRLIKVLLRLAAAGN